MSLRDWFRAGLGSGTIGHVPGTKPPPMPPLPSSEWIITFPTSATPAEIETWRRAIGMWQREGERRGIRRAAGLLRRLGQDECAAQVEALLDTDATKEGA